jgi:hypothetical protein
VVFIVGASRIEDLATSLTKRISIDIDLQWLPTVMRSLELRFDGLAP